jgi:hypothetical protein
VLYHRPVVEIIEGVTNLAAGAAREVIATKVTQKLPGNISMVVGYEAALVAAGLWGGAVGLGRELRDPLMMSGLTLLGARSAKLAMAGKLFTPSEWGAGGGGDNGVGAPIDMPSRLAPGVRQLGMGRGGSFGLYPQTREGAGVAG